MPLPFSESSFRKICDTHASSANARCGQFHELYVRFFCELIEQELENVPTENRAEAICIARNYDYCTKEELAEEDLDDDTCRHGLDYDCCPLGCGDM